MFGMVHSGRSFVSVCMCANHVQFENGKTGTVNKDEISNKSKHNLQTVYKSTWVLILQRMLTCPTWWQLMLPLKCAMGNYPYG